MLLSLSGSELLLYSGLGAMTIAVILAVLCTIAMSISGRKLKRKLEQEYGKPRH